MLNLLLYFLLFFIPYNTSTQAEKIIYITPGLWGNLFDPYYESMCKVKQALMYKGYGVEQADSIISLPNIALLITFDLPFQELDYLKQYPKNKCIAFLWEPPSVVPDNYNLSLHEHFSKIYTWHDDLVDNKKYFKFYYPVCHPIINSIISFTEKKLCTFIFANKYSQHPQELYSERHNIINFFENINSHDFDFYGRFWDPALYKNYKGPVAHKIDILKLYKFCICYENIKDMPGYITEKIFDCFQAGCVPIYWGAPNINNYIPTNCYINRQNFSNNQELYIYLKNMSEQEYNKYIHAIKKFLISPAAYYYSIDYFVNIICNLVTESLS